MQRVVRRDGDALAELYDLYAARVFGLCLRILNENQLAEDTLQEVFLRVWERAQLFEQSRGTVNAWLMGIARNTCIDQLRRMRTRPQAAEQAEGPDALPFEETLADLVVVDRDMFSIDPMAIRDIQVLGTLVGADWKFRQF